MKPTFPLSKPHKLISPTTHHRKNSTVPLSLRKRQRGRDDAIPESLHPPSPQPRQQNQLQVPNSAQCQRLAGETTEDPPSRWRWPRRRLQARIPQSRVEWQREARQEEKQEEGLFRQVERVRGEHQEGDERARQVRGGQARKCRQSEETRRYSV